MAGRRFDGVLFDLFGTLVSMGVAGARQRSLERMARTLGVDPPAFVGRWQASFDARARGTFGGLEATLEHLARELGRSPPPGAIARAARTRLAFSRTLLRSDRRIVGALDALRRSGVRLALVTDTTEETVRLWPSTVLASRFEVAVFSCLEGVRKPEPAIYRRGLARLRLDAVRCAFVGDGGSHELTGARAVGLTAFRYRFPDERQDPADRLEAEDDWVGPELADLRELLPPGG